MPTPAIITEAQALFRFLADVLEDRHAALRLTLALTSLRVAKVRQVLRITTLPQALAAAPLGLTTLPDSARLRSAWEMSASFPRDALTPRLPGALYPHLMQTTTALDPASDLRETRRRGGVYYTPESIAKRILDLALGDGANPGAVCDPAMGAGHFLVALALRLRTRGLARARRLLNTQCYGVDRDPVAVWLARVALWLALSKAEDPWLPDTTHLLQRDALLGGDSAGIGDFPWADAFPAVAERGGFDAVVGNPPYDVLTRFRRDPVLRETAAALRGSGAYPLSCSGQINLYRCFIERGLSLLRSGGRLSFVVPAGLMRDRTAAPLRRALLEQHGANHFELYRESDKAFTGVRQSVVIFRAQKNAGAPATVHLATPRHAERVDARVIHSLSDDWALPDAGPDTWPLLRWLAENCPRRFSDLAHGRVGEVDQTVYRDCMRGNPTPTLLVRGTHLAPFAVDLAPIPSRQRFLDGELFLQRKGRQAGAVARRVGQERVAQLGIRNMQSRPRLLAARLPGGVYAGNSLNVWWPRAGVSLELILGLLNSALYDWRFRAISGNNNINLHEVTELPLPPTLDPRAVRAVECCARRGEAATTERALADARARLDAAVYGLFGVPKDLLPRAGS